MRIRVYYEDTDSGGVVYYANYLRFCERARTEFLRERGVEVAAHDAEGVIFVVARVEIAYRAPARYNDLLEIDTRIIDRRRTSFTFRHRILHGETEKLLAEADVRLVCVGAKGKPRRLPGDVARVVSCEVEDRPSP
jgi:acyl-CoA thioester hydrolase